MIVLTAIQLSVNNEYQFRIEAPDNELWTTGDPLKAARMLQRYGVKDPLTKVAHAQEWGLFEILDTVDAKAV